MSEAWGPWAPDCNSQERISRLRVLRAIAGLILRSDHLFVDTLRRAERDPEALKEASELLGLLPAISMRRIVATYALNERQEKAR
jgi:hypothetical protein